MIYQLLTRLLPLLVVAVSVNATTYFVSPSGNDDNSGLSEAQAWASIDHGDDQSLLYPGDTVNILAGTYVISRTIELKTDGEAGAPIVYRGYGGQPIIDAENRDFPIITISKSFIRVEGLELRSSRKHGIQIKEDSCVIARCMIRNVANNGIQIDRSGNRVIRTVILQAGMAGVLVKKESKAAYVYGNTIANCNTGIDLEVNGNKSRVLDNIIVSCTHGISGVIGNLCAYNLLWDNGAGDYFGGVTDSAGGLSVDPLFVDTATADYRLGFGSPAIDAGIDIGCVFTGLAPDLGAFETGELDHLQILPVRDTLCADSSYQFSVVAYDSADGPASTGVLTWSHTFATGSIDSTGLFSPVGVGTGEVSVLSSLNGVTDTTGSMYVRAGAPTNLIVNPDTATVSAGDYQQFSVFATDKNANAVSDFGLITWILSDSIGSVDSTGLFAATTAGTGTVSAHSSLGLADTTGNISVIPGPPAVLEVLPSTNVVPTLQTYQYSALAYDAFANLVGNFTDSVTWTTTDLVGSVTSSGLYTAGLVGTYWVKAAHLGVRDSGSVTVSLGGGLDHVHIEYFDGSEVGTPSLTTDIDTTHFFVRGYTAAEVPIGDVSADWTIVGADSVAELLPNIGPSTNLILNKPGTIRIAVVDANGLTDTTGNIVVSPGLAVSLTIAPRTDTLSSGDTVRFTAFARDKDHNPVDPQPVSDWSVLGGIGAIDSTGLFTATFSGTGQIVAQAGGLVDTSGPIKVVAGSLVSIRIQPDSVALGIGDTVQYTAVGLDSAGNITNPGVITWRAHGRSGTIDASGRFIANAPGPGAVSALNQLADIADTAALRVEELYLSTIPLGNSSIRPGGDETAVTAFRIDNYFTTPRTVTSILIRDLSTGTGTAEQLAANMSAARLYADTDGDSLVSESDTLLAEVTFDAAEMTFSLPGLEISADSGVTFIVTALSAATARDGDTVDIALIPGADIMTADSTIVAGPPLSNSLGVVTIDGMVASQIALVPTVQDSVTTADSLQLVLIVDLPRNGYRTDSLTTFSVANVGTATELDFDSLVLLADDGDGLWEGSANEIPLGRLVYNGEDWSRGGLNCPLISATTRLFVAAQINRFPVDGGTIVVGIPIDGVRVRSTNDGPIDEPVFSTDTLRIVGRQAIISTLVPVPPATVVPGQVTGPLLAVQLTNGYSQAVALDSCRFTFESTDPLGATLPQLQGQVDSIYLLVNRDGAPPVISIADTVIAAAPLVNGVASFGITPLSISGQGGSVTLVVAAKLGLLTCRNGNTISFSLADSSAIVFDQPVRHSGAFPLRNPGTYVIDAFPASAVMMYALPSGNLYAGQVDEPVMDFALPRNGYAQDRLTRLDIVNSATLDEVKVLDHVRLWRDVSANGFTPDDALIGEFSYVGPMWRLSDIRAPLDLPLNRFIVTVSIAGDKFDGGTLRFDLPASAVVTLVGMTGPDGAPVVNPATYLVFPSDRVTTISIPQSTAVVHSGATDQMLMAFALYNGYSDQTKTLSQLTLTNSSRSRGSDGFADHELGQVSLFMDINRNRILDNDVLIGTGLFADDKLRFDGFAAALPPESLVYFFVVADLPLDLIDSDSLSASIVQPTDLSFRDFVNLNGDFPITSGGYLVVDGSVRKQYGLFGPTGRSLAPGDTAVVLLAFSPAHNGDQPDWLEELALANLGSADTATLSQLTLWHDVNVDNIPNAGDAAVGVFSFNSGIWRASGLDFSVLAPQPHLIVVGDIAATAVPGATVRLAVPLLGCSMQSDNDGPLDSAVVAPGWFTISTSGLKTSLGPLQESYSVGQSIDIALSVTNIAGQQLFGVTSPVPELLDSTLVRLDSSLAVPVDLLPSDSWVFHHYYTALAAGSEFWNLRALSVTPQDSSALVQTPVVMMQRAVSPVAPQLLNTSPTAVTKGQTNVLPMTLVCSHPDTTTNTAALTLGSLRLRVEDGQGNATSANSVFSRMVLATGFDILAVVTSVPAQSTVSFTFDNAVTIGPGEAQSFILIADIASNASPSDFRLSIDGASWIPLADANTGVPVQVASSVTFPLRTASTRIDVPSQQVAISSIPYSVPTINVGQQNASILKLLVRHSGQPGTSPAQITRLALEVVDSSGIRLQPSDVFDRVSLRNQSYVVGENYPTPQDSAELVISLTTPVTLNPQEVDSLTIAVSAASVTAANGFSLRIVDSSRFTVRDLNTGSILLAVSDTTLATGTVFPILSPWSAFRIPAEPPAICLTDISPTSVVGGADSAQLLSLDVTYPGSPQHSDVRLARVRLRVVDKDDIPLDPGALFDRVGTRTNGGPVLFSDPIAGYGGVLDLWLADTGLVLSSGDSAAIEVIGDLRLEAPYSSFAIKILGLDEFDSYDLSDTSRALSVQPAVGCTGSFPFSSGVTSILLPAGRPTASPITRPVQITSPGMQQVVMFEATLSYLSSSPLGQIEIRGLNATLRRRSSSGEVPDTPMPSLTNVQLQVGGTVIGVDSILSGSIVAITAPSPVVVSRGETLPIRLIGDVSPVAEAGNILLTLVDTTFLTIVDQASQSPVYPVLQGISFPFAAGELSIGGADLESSFSNYPNPFNPALGQGTTIGFVLGERATIDIDLFTITGELVCSLVRQSDRDPGAYQSDIWSGKNGDGQAVLPGVYFCRITATYDSGRVESFRRKVALVR